ncbi:MAG: DUF4296 domain-containing protein [Bacteroidales bacterium]|nr:DUF4296 domain-containing protein [Bacteroidales bacterium]
MKLKIFYTVFFVLFISFGCSNKKEYFIPKKDLVPLLVDLHIADALGLDYSIKREHSIIDSANLYGSLLSKHGFTKEQFDSTLAYYAIHTNEFDALYEKVFAQLSKLEDDLKSSEEDEADISGPQTLYNELKTYVLPEDSKNDIEPVSLSIEIKKKGTYTVTADILLYEDDQSINPNMVVFFWYDDGSPKGHREYFEFKPLQKDGKTHRYTTSKKLTDKKVTHLKGYMLNYESQEIDWTQHAVVSNINVTFE